MFINIHSYIIPLYQVAETNIKLKIDLNKTCRQYYIYLYTQINIKYGMIVMNDSNNKYGCIPINKIIIGKRLAHNMLLETIS